jgi:hypothetical protein
MATPVGVWDLVTNLHNAVLNIANMDAAGNVTGTIQMDSSHTYNITGTWNAQTNELKFSYSYSIVLKWFHEFFVVSFDGYLFEAGQPLFNASPGPVATPAWNMLAGTYKVGPIFVNSGATYGWVARSQNQI